MKLKGFTLAEVLITLALIGVVASLTMPALMSNVQKQQVGPALAKAINTLETANQNYKASHSVNDIRRVCSGSHQSSLFACLIDDGQINVVYLEDELRPVYHKFNSDNTFSYIHGGDDDYVAYQSSDGMIYYVMMGDTGIIEIDSTKKKKYSGEYYIVDVDINGTKGPNTDGKDLFSLAVDTKGIVIPLGGALWGDYTNKDVQWKTSCNKDQVTLALTCAGSIADNGWKVIYPY